VSDVLDAGAVLADKHRFAEAIALLSEANRSRPDSDIEKALVQIRHEAVVRSDPKPSASEWPGSYEDRFIGVAAIPEVVRADLTTEVLGAALQHHGSLIVRGLVSPDRIDALTSEIDSVFDGYDEVAAADDAVESLPWYSPFPADGDYSWTFMERLWTRKLGGVVAADSPRAIFGVLDALHGSGLGPVLEGYLGEWPALSVKKFTLRRTPHDAPSEWHQDGSFLGENTRTVNVWLSLSHCGVDAPGLDIVPQRFDSIVETGTDDSLFDWSVSRVMADRVSGGRVASPVFAPGDAVLFDQMTLHRTRVTPGMSKTRYAIESWFFAPTTYPHVQIPIAF